MYMGTINIKTIIAYYQLVFYMGLYEREAY